MIRSYAAAVKNISSTDCVASGTTTISSVTNSSSVSAATDFAAAAASSVNDSFPPCTQSFFPPGRMVKAPRPSDAKEFTIVTSRQERPRLQIFKDLETREQEFSTVIGILDSGADLTPPPTVKDECKATNPVHITSIKDKRSQATTSPAPGSPAPAVGIKDRKDMATSLTPTSSALLIPTLHEAIPNKRSRVSTGYACADSSLSLNSAAMSINTATDDYMMETTKRVLNRPNYESGDEDDKYIDDDDEEYHEEEELDTVENNELTSEEKKEGTKSGAVCNVVQEILRLNGLITSPEKATLRQTIDQVQTTSSAGQVAVWKPTSIVCEKQVPSNQQENDLAPTVSSANQHHEPAIRKERAVWKSTTIVCAEQVPTIQLLMEGMRMLKHRIAPDTKVRPFRRELMDYLSTYYKEGHVTFVFSTGLVVHAKVVQVKRDEPYRQLYLKVIDCRESTVNDDYISIRLNTTMIRTEESKIVSGVSIKLPVMIYVSIHIVVCWTFHGPSTSIDNESVDHINGIKTDNRLENLRWAGHQLQSYNQRKNTNIRLGCGQKCEEHGGFHRATKRLCQMEMCGKYAQAGGYCIRHGGGARCM
ncbi:hypothetical protein ACHAXH_001247, partial [Discostella pseudostelligera]